MTDDGAVCVIPRCVRSDGTPRPAAVGALICPMHTQQLATTLRTIVDTAALLPLYVVPGNGEEGEGRGRRAEPPAPPRLDVVALGDPRSTDDHGAPTAVLAVLAGWADVVRAGRQLPIPMSTVVDRVPNTPPGPIHTDCGHPSCARRRAVRQVAAAPTLTGEYLTLARHATWIAAQPWVPALWREATRLERALRAAAADPPPKPLGECPVRTGDVVCGTPLYPSATGESVRCRACGAVWAGVELIRLRMMLEAADTPTTKPT